VQVISRNFIFSPVLNYFGVDRAKISEVYISQEIGEKYLREFARLQEIEEIKHVLGVAKAGHESEENFREQVQELFKEAGYESQDGWKNLLSDITGLIAFIAILIFGRQQLAITRAYVSRYFLSLNDITKAFIFILFTDIFVGFHSPHGWEVILEGLSRHFGLPENREFNFLFIATFPVILDTVLKYWIFRYLNRISPSAVATYRNMNE
jgi:phage-related protein